MIDIYNKSQKAGPRLRLYESQGRHAYDVAPFSMNNLAGARRAGWLLSLKFGTDVLIMVEDMQPLEYDPRCILARSFHYVERIQHKTVMEFAIAAIQHAPRRMIIEGERLRSNGEVNTDRVFR